ncbi:MAG TPA: Fic family protein [Candidatus Baltobacteraceae bacterium]|nr:Fic family protein [Candidatus Baltobacteraceae bacterium]
MPQNISAMSSAEPAAWHPIEDLPADWLAISVPELAALARVWKDQASSLEHTDAFKTFMTRMRREIAIETGIIERLYTLDRGITQLLIEHGFDEALIPHGATDKNPRAVIEIIRDQESAIEALFDFVSRKRQLSTSYIKELHALLTQHQLTTEAVTPDGEILTIELLRGAWKVLPNNPLRDDKIAHWYCPPEHVASEMDNLIRMHHEHERMNVSPEVEAAWLHHRFTEIHPFQDGNGRVARCLATLVFIQAKWFPLVIRDSERAQYIGALETADAGDLSKLIALFAAAERRAFIRSVSLSEEILSDARHARAIIGAVATRIQKKHALQTTERVATVEAFAQRLFEIARVELERIRDEIIALLPPPAGKRQIAELFAQPNGAEHADWRGWQINQVANHFQYFANRRDYSAFLQLRIYYRPLTDILLSFHVPGPRYIGILICTASAFRNTPTDTGHLLAVDLEPISESPFQFSYADEEAELERRFGQWLEQVIINGLNYWQQEV